MLRAVVIPSNSDDSERTGDAWSDTLVVRALSWVVWSAIVVFALFRLVEIPNRSDDSTLIDED